ncbi:Ankyrin repeat domain-containing protein [Tetrabaena socialis]|uniref:Ankyrin repeat domain-containing protein n=1 Tax=Tetrabaena socialis TaxID=47790 RepID=A0A2J8AE62_9CHLO|nr:Ankyrin repeat domain-containing protein [Tetrabaena socialis]|eukprot:PNH10810.1 Ankyrin repeat domain-containing protein [Tetrabaena socialis]
MEAQERAPQGARSHEEPRRVLDSGADEVGTPFLHLLVCNGDVAGVEWMLENSATNVDMRDKNGCTALHLAGYLGNREMIRLLCQAGGNPNARNNGGCTPLQLCSSKGHKEAAEQLMRLGAHVNATDDYGRAALHAASMEGWPEVAELLVSSGANVHQRDDHALTPLDRARRKRGVEADGGMWARYTQVVGVLQAAEAAARADANGGEQQQVRGGETAYTAVEASAASTADSKGDASTAPMQGPGAHGRNEKEPKYDRCNTELATPSRGAEARGNSWSGGGGVAVRAPPLPARSQEGEEEEEDYDDDDESVVSQEVTSPLYVVPNTAAYGGNGPSPGDTLLVRAWC